MSDEPLSADECTALANILDNPPPVPEFLRDVLPTQAERAGRFKAWLDKQPDDWREVFEAP